MEHVGQTLGPDPILKTLELEERAKVGNRMPNMAPPSVPFKGRFLVRVKNAARQVSCYNRLESKPAK
jgi:hypothetical protein